MIVSQKVIIINKEGNILALRRSETDPGRPLTWDIPGGQLEDGEDPIEGIRRETREETGMELGEISIFDVAANYGRTGDCLVQICYLTSVDTPEVVLSYEHDQFQWISRAAFLELESSEKIKRFLMRLK